MALFKKRIKARKLTSMQEIDQLVASGKPVLIDFFQIGCSSCKVMDGIVDELAEEYGDSAHLVKVDVARVHGAAAAFAIRSTPTFVLLGAAPVKKSKKSSPRPNEGKVTSRWRASGLVKKDQMARILESNGAVRAG
jgi:thioredoxin 1